MPGTTLDNGLTPGQRANPRRRALLGARPQPPSPAGSGQPSAGGGANAWLKLLSRKAFHRVEKMSLGRIRKWGQVPRLIMGEQSPPGPPGAAAGNCQPHLGEKEGG